MKMRFKGSVNMKKVISFLGIKGLTSLFIIFIVFIFCIQNSEPILIRFFFWDLLEISKVYLVLFSIFLGMVLGGIFSWMISGDKKDKISTY